MNGKVMNLLGSFVRLPATALAVTVEPFPPGEYADTEVLTNIPIRVDLERLDRMRFVR